MNPPFHAVLMPAAIGRWRGNRNVGLVAMMAVTLAVGTLLAAGADSTNGPSTNTAPLRTESAPPKLDEAAFRIIAERNIFNAERIGVVRVASSRRPARIETFKLVGTMAYAKGAFAFFEGSNSELTKAVKMDGIIAGHKVVDILTDGVKLEADGKIVEVAIGSAMRREDEGTWRPGEAIVSSASPSFASGRESSRDNDNGRSSRYDRSDRENDSSRRRGNESERDGGESNRTAASSAASTADQSEILKRLMERREKESQ